MPPAPPSAPAEDTPVVPEAVDTSEPMLAAVVEVRSAVQEAVDVSPPPPENLDAEFAVCAAFLITKWEIGSPARYTKKYEGVIWPGGASGPTWGVGYDGGHQTRRDILADWHAHDSKEKLATSSGVLGEIARRQVANGVWQGVLTPYSYAERVFVESTLPQYTAAARRALGPGFVSLPPGTRCALVSLGYNRGWNMVGPRNVEKRVIRDECLTDLAGAPACVATQLRSMKRLWPETPGLQNRRDDEARVAAGGRVALTPKPPAAAPSPSLIKKLPQLYAPAKKPTFA